MLSRTLLFCCCLFVASHVEGANILGVFTMHSPSHNIIHTSILKVLANAGHNITVVTMIPLKEKNHNFHHILLPTTPEDQVGVNNIIKNLPASRGVINTIRDIFVAMRFMHNIEQRSLQEPAFQELLNNKENHFDLMILGYGFNDFHFGIADHFKCPIILSWVNLPVGKINGFVGNPDGVSYIPMPWLGSDPMGFVKRIANMFISGLLNGMMDLVSRPVESFYKNNFPAERGYRSLEDMRRNVSLIFCSTFLSEKPIRPTVPNFIEIGGIQAKEKPDPLPKDIEEFLSKADDGFIFFSLGSNIKGSDFDANATQIIFNVLSKRKEKVLWKWDTPEGPGKSSNIKYGQWLPQDDILAHPKIKVFITHGGKGSITEAQYHGVPMLALPVFADQIPNSNAMQSQGYGLVLPHRTMTENEFATQLDEVISNSTYYEKIREYSNLYRDRPMTAQQSVVYWAEYVMRYHGAAHLQSPKVHLSFWQYNCLDVIGFLLVVLYVAYRLLKCGVMFATKFLCRTLCKGKNLKKNKKE